MKKTLLSITILLSLFAQAQNALFIPDTIAETSINLSLQNGSHQFYSGMNTTTMGANGNVLGPTLMLNQGDFVNFNVSNKIDDTTTIHWHGMHVSADNDGGPHTTIPPNSTWKPSFKILDKAATYWYHPHLHEKTNKHVSLGIAGLILVSDTDEAKLSLPRNYGTDDFPLVVQTKDFDGSKQIVTTGNSDDVVMVNATIDPYLDVPAQVIRFRVLNGSSQRAFNFGLSSNKSFYQIASDGGLLAKPVKLTRMMLTPGERAEILVDFSGMNGTSINLMSYASELPNGIYGATNPGMGAGMTLNGYKPNPLNGANYVLLKINVKAPNSNPVTTIPNDLVNVNPIPEASSMKTRTFTFNPVTMGPNQLNGEFLINNTAFDMKIINEKIPLSNIEIWELSNFSGISHPFHIHDVQFYILSRNGSTPPPNEQGRKDVVLVKPQETVRFIAHFENFSGKTPYMYHCHLLPHEDGGMMGQFTVESPLSINDNEEYGADINVFPNPSNGLINVLINKGYSYNYLDVYDQFGRKVENLDTSINGEKIIIDKIPAGLYFLKIGTSINTLVKKIIVN